MRTNLVLEPDHDVWVEVKGHLTKTAARKIEDFQAQGHRLVMVTYRQVRAAGLPSSLDELFATSLVGAGSANSKTVSEQEE